MATFKLSSVIQSNYFNRVVAIADKQHECFLAVVKVLAGVVSKEHITSCYVDDQKLLIYCTSPVWASRVQIELPRYLPKLQNEHPELFKPNIKALTKVKL